MIARVGVVCVGVLEVSFVVSCLVVSFCALWVLVRVFVRSEVG